MEGGWRKSTHYATESANPPLTQAVARLAEAQHAVVALRQLKALGMSESGVRTHVRRGRLHRIHGGVYAVGHPLISADGRRKAAVLACGEGAVLSHRSAAALWDIRATSRRSIDVTSPRRTGRDRAGITVHSGATLHPEDITTRREIPCTTLARTLLDLTEVLDRRAVERAIDQAEVLRILDAREIYAVLDRAPGRRGAHILRAILAEHQPGSTITRNELEEALLEICDDVGLPRPRVNAWITLAGGEAFEVDFLWEEQRLIVETDGWGAHGTRRAFEHDRRRDQKLMLAGWRVARCSRRQVVHERRQLGAILTGLLA